MHTSGLRVADEFESSDEMPNEVNYQDLVNSNDDPQELKISQYPYSEAEDEEDEEDKSLE
jgi:hypothetical protein